MEFTRLSIQILIYVVLLLSTQTAPSYTIEIPAFPSISPDRLQFFEYESVSLSCGADKGMKAWRVKKLNKMSQANETKACSIPASSCKIDFTFERYSGEYWCENDQGLRSRSLNIAVTVGPVILAIPAKPVKEGSDVILRCLNKDSEKIHISDLYKNGLLLTTYYKRYMTLSKVSKSDEGLYKCKISHVGESPESRLVVVKPSEEGSDEETPSTNQAVTLAVSVCTIFTLLFLVIGLILYKKYKAMRNKMTTDPMNTTYDLVNKPRKRNGGETANEQDNVTYAAIEIKKKARSKVSPAALEEYSSEQQSTYSTIALKRGI